MHVTIVEAVILTALLTAIATILAVAAFYEREQARLLAQHDRKVAHLNHLLDTADALVTELNDQISADERSIVLLSDTMTKMEQTITDQDNELAVLRYFTDTVEANLDDQLAKVIDLAPYSSAVDKHMAQAQLVLFDEAEQ